MRREEDRRCRCYERQRPIVRGDGSLSHTRWNRGRSCPGERGLDRGMDREMEREKEGQLGRVHRLL